MIKLITATLKLSIRWSIIMVGILFFSPCHTQSLSLVHQNVFSKIKNQEFHERGGLPNIFKKVSTKRQVRIGYFGGSITEAEQGWRDLTFGWFQLTFPQTAFYQTNASIGGTGSDLGSFRVDTDLLSAEPDLVFIEFAVNDADRSKESIIKSMEGIVRKIRIGLPQTDICLIYTTSESLCKAMLADGKINKAVQAMEEVATHYNIPSINLGIEVARLYEEGKLILSGNVDENARTIVFTKDHTHPLPESGHPIYGSVVVKYLKEMSGSRLEITPHTLTKPLVENNWQQARMVDISKADLDGDWSTLGEKNTLSRRFLKFMPVIYKGAPDAVMRFRFKGSVFGFYDCIGPGTGIIDIIIDGKKQEKYRFDKYCYYYRKSYFLIDNLPNEVHEVVIRVASRAMDKIKILGRNQTKIEEETDYVETNWYPSKILIIGNLIE